MRKLAMLIALGALLGIAAPPAHAAKRLPYKGKTSGGHDVTFRYDAKKHRAYDFVTGVPMQCISIQGGGAPMSGVELWSFRWIELGLKNYKFSEQSKPSLYYNEVTRNHTVTITRPGRRGVVKGSIRVQYEFLIPKYPIGTFTIYSCLGTTKLTARPRR